MSAPQDDTLLIFRIDCIPCAVPAASVQSIVMPPGQLTQPPGSDQGRPGIFRHAQHVYAVVDLHQRFGIDIPRKGMGRYLLHESGQRRHALWVDEVVGLVRQEEGKWATLPHYLPRELFHGGFLYQDDIVLCSTIEALLAMSDAGPIRRHWESLQQRRQPPAKIHKEEKSAPPPSLPSKPEKPEPSAGEEKKPVTVIPPRPATVKPRPLPPRKPIPKPKAPTPPRPAITSRATSAPRPQPAPPPTAPTPAPQHQTKDGNWLLWLVVIVLLLGGLGTAGYLLLAKPEKVKRTPPRYSKPAPVITPPRPVETAKPEPRITLPPLEPPATAEPAPVEMSAIQIERDDQGTISLIIERDQLHLPPLAEPQPITEASEEGEEAPLEPDADWPQPTSLPEPCDCTHVVVKGDTLWAIAKKYTNNAYNYPELARQSGIRNPHRIYPGDTVRIIVR